MIVIDEIVAADLQRGRPFGPGFSERVADIVPRTFERGTLSKPELEAQRCPGLVFEDEVIAASRFEDGGIDYVVTGIEEYGRTRERHEVAGERAVDAVCVLLLRQCSTR